MPDKYEIGSHNAIGLAGLAEAVAWLLNEGLGKMRQRDRHLSSLFLELTDDIEHLKVYGPRDIEVRSGVFSVNIDSMPSVELAKMMERDFGILARPGVHCAPLAHKTIGTHPAGTCRLSFGPFTTEEHIRYTADALAKIAERTAVGK